MSPAGRPSRPPRAPWVRQYYSAATMTSGASTTCDARASFICEVTSSTTGSATAKITRTRARRLVTRRWPRTKQRGHRVDGLLCVTFPLLSIDVTA